MKYAVNISNDDVAALEAVHFGGHIEVVETPDALAKACKELAKHSIIGFDTETRPSFTAGVSNKVALLQLSTEDRCYLIRLNKVALSRDILAILSSKSISKVGADVRNDISALNKLRHFRAGGFVELQREVEPFGIEDKSLRKMAAIILGVGVSKAQRLSNWEAREMTSAQLRYAATDAWVCLKMYRALFGEGVHAPKFDVFAQPKTEAKPKTEHTEGQPKPDAPAHRKRRRPHRNRKKTKQTQSQTS